MGIQHRGQPSVGQLSHANVVRELHQLATGCGFMRREWVNAGIEQPKTANAARRSSHDLERNASAHGVPDQNEALRRRAENVLGHRFDGGETSEVDDADDCQVAQASRDVFPDRAIAEQSCKQHEMMFAVDIVLGRR